MASGLAAFAAGLGAGALQGAQLADEKKRQGLRDAMVKAQFDWAQQDRDKAQKLEGGLADAIRPASVVEGAGGMLRSADMDDRDVGLSENFNRAPQVLDGQVRKDAPTPMNGGLSSALYRGANGQQFSSREEAQKSVDAYNAPDQVGLRTSNAYRAAGKPVEALEFETKNMQAQAARQELADTAWRKQLGEAMRGGHDSMAQLVTGSQMGPMAGRNVKAVPSADGKTVTYNEVQPDGTLKPMPQFTFSNDENGVMKAGYLLDNAITPEHRYTTFVAEEKSKAEVARQQARDDESKRHNLAVEGVAQQRVDGRAGGGLGAPPSGYRWKADGTQEVIPGGPADKQPGAGKALPTKTASDLRSQAELADTTDRLSNSFQPGYAGHTLVGEISNSTKRVMGDDTGQSQWWQDYALHEATVRNKLFGASLTPGEQAQWTKLTITPRMEPKQVQQNLQRRAEIEQRSLDRQMRSAVAGGYNAGQVEEETGRKVPPAGAGVVPARPAAAMPTKQSDLRSGQVYNTARGPARWNGTAFEAQ